RIPPRSTPFCRSFCTRSSRRGTAPGPAGRHPWSGYTRSVVTATIQSTLARAAAALERGRGAEAAQLLTQLQRSGSLSRDDEWTVRSNLAEAWLLQDNLAQATAALGRPPDGVREQIAPARLSTLWRLHGRVAFARGEQSRAIAL